MTKFVIIDFNKKRQQPSPLPFKLSLPSGGGGVPYFAAA